MRKIIIPSNKLDRIIKNMERKYQLVFTSENSDNRSMFIFSDLSIIAMGHNHRLFVLNILPKDESLIIKIKYLNITRGIFGHNPFYRWDKMIEKKVERKIKRII